MSDEIKEVARATEEVAKTAGKAVDAGRELGGFLNRVFGGLVEDAVGLAADKLKYYRMGRAIELANKTENRLRQKGIQVTRPVPLKVGIPLLEAATLEEDDDLHTMWANLLATAMDAEHEEISRKYVSVLTDLSPYDAKNLTVIFNTMRRYEFDPQRPMSFAVSGFGSVGGRVNDQIEDSLRNLMRLSLIKSSPYFLKPRTKRSNETEIELLNAQGENQYVGREQGANFGLILEPADGVPILVDIARVVLTPFGLSFCRAVGLGDSPSDD